METGYKVKPASSVDDVDDAFKNRDVPSPPVVSADGPAAGPDALPQEGKGGIRKEGTEREGNQWGTLYELGDGQNYK
jgi:hypothetical protein